MEEKDFSQKGNTISVTFIPDNKLDYQASRNYHIGGITEFQVQLDLNDHETISCSNLSLTNTNISTLIYIRFTQLCPDNVLTYKIKLKSKRLNIDDISFDNDNTWHLVHAITSKSFFEFDLNLQVDFISGTCVFAPLYKNNHITDFELRGEDGSIRVHRVVLASCSPVLRAMLNGTWKETTEGLVEVAGTSVLTLQHLKDYLYLHRLPESGLEQLMLLASFYIMPDLEQSCVFKLMTKITEENAYDMLQFGFDNKLTKLCIPILKCIQVGVVTVDKISLPSQEANIVVEQKETNAEQ